MATLDIPHTRSLLQTFEFKILFIEELGWSQPPLHKPKHLNHEGIEFEIRQIAELAGVIVLEITTQDGAIPNARTRAMVHKDIAKHHHENLLIFLDRHRTQSLWYWVKREDGKAHPREHLYVQGQPGDLFLSKLSAMVVDIGELAQGDLSVVQVARRLKNALDVEPVTKKFYGEFSDRHLAFLSFIRGVENEWQRRWYASVILNRLMFIYFLQRKGFVDNGKFTYLQARLADTRKKYGPDRYFSRFLKLLFFEGFAKPEDQRSAEARETLGAIRYLNGGLFLLHQVEQQNPQLDVSDQAFHNLFALFERYSWNLNDTPGGADNELNPDVLGYIFEKYINQKAFGAYYTRPEITEYLSEATIYRLVLNAVNTPETIQAHHLPGVKVYRYQTIPDLLMDLDAPLCRKLLHEVLPNLSLLDPACGSGAFLVAAMKTLINLYAAAIGKIKFLHDRNLSSWLAQAEREHKSLGYFIKKRIITDNLYGVDLMEEATEIAKLRLFLTLVASAETVEQLEPLPNIDFNILAGNSLIGLMRVGDQDFDQRHAQGHLYRKSYREVLQEKNRLVDTYRHATTYAQDLTALRDSIQEKKQEAVQTLDDILIDEFKKLGIKYEQATWDDKKNDEGKPVKRSLTLTDIQTLKPFHWGFEFDKVLNERGGFDAIITNPPWEIFKPNAKEFFQEHSDLVTKKKMTIHDFEKEQTKLLKDDALRIAWLEYLSSYPHVSAFYRKSPQYRNQISIVNGKKAGSDINIYKLFTEQCFNLLRPGGECGIVIPSGIYTDLGTKQLRQMFFDQTQVTGLFCFENRKMIFENVDSRFKFVVLTFGKSGQTASFPAAFMRHDVAELQGFPQQGAIDMSVELIRRLSPDSLSVMEFKNEMDVTIAQKMSAFPMLGEKMEDKWNLVLGNEFHMTGDSRLFRTSPDNGCLPLYEGKMIWQFDHRFGEPRYWVDEKDGRKAIVGRSVDDAELLGYQQYRMGHRSVASSTNERTMIAAILPVNVFFGHSINAQRAPMRGDDMLFVTSLLNSFIVDYSLRSSVSANLTMFFIYQLPVPRLSRKDKAFGPIVERATRLICTTSEFDDLAKEVGFKSHKAGTTDSTERAKLRAELDGLIAHLYGLTEEEFAYVLTTFPIVPDPVKIAALNAYRDVERGLIR